MTAIASRPSRADVAAIRAHPRFGAAMRTAAQSVIALYRGNRLLNPLMNDRARSLFTVAALYLHYRGIAEGRSGLTVGAMKELCVRIGLCSRGRCEATLVLLRAAGFLASAPDGDRRRRPLVPTEKLFALQRQRMRAHLGAMTLIMPEAVDYHAAMDDPEFVRRLVLAMSDDFIGGTRMSEHAPELKVIIERNAGLLILFSLALSGPPDGAFPPEQPVPLSINALAKTYSVSRKHVLTLLRDAEALGLLARGGALGDQITILPRGRVALECFVAAIFAWFAEGGRLALESAGGPRPLAVAAE
jgi:hypothetical protein